MSHPHPLPTEMPAPATRRQLVLLCAGVALVFVLVNVLAGAYLSWNTVGSTEHYIERKWRMVHDRATPAQILVIGDSSGNQGIDTALLATELGLVADPSGEPPAVNACSIGWLGLVDGAWKVQDHIARLGPPGAVVICHVYDVWPRNRDSIAEQVRTTPISPEVWRDFEPSLGYSDWDLLKIRFRQDVLSWLPLYTRSDTLAKLLSRPKNLLRRAPDNFDTTGFMRETQPNPRVVASETAEHLESVGKHPFALSEINRESLESILRLSALHGFPVYLVISPVSEGLAAEPLFHSHLASMNEALRAVLDPFPRAHLLETRPAGFPPELMQSADHMIAEAAATFTRSLAAQIRELEGM